MIDIERESLLTLAQASALLPGRPCVATLWRWRFRGLHGRKLETVVIGAKPYTSKEALARFAKQQGGTNQPTIRTTAKREQAIRKAEAELADGGI